MYCRDSIIVTIIYFFVCINDNIANKIGEAGMKSLLDAVQYQSQLAVAHSRNVAVGLLRLSLKVDLCRIDHTLPVN